MIGDKYKYLDKGSPSDKINYSYSDYNELMRPSNRNNFMDFSLYAKFGQLMAQLFIELNRYQYLNALLKINDIIISNKERLNQNEMKLCKLSVSAEYEIVRDELTKRSLD